MADDEDTTLWCGNLAENVTEEFLYELFLQAGPLERVKIPTDREGRRKNYGFITYCHRISVPYAIKLFRGTTLFHKTIVLRARSTPVSLPPPTRVYRSEGSSYNFSQELNEMNEHLREDDSESTSEEYEYPDRQKSTSLEENWSHRHHPYKSKDKYRNDYRPKERDHHHHKHSGKRHSHSSNRRDRRNHRSHHKY